MKKKLAATLSVVLILGLAVLGILAYLTSEDSDVNVMTLGEVKIVQNEYQLAEDGVTLEPFEQEKGLYPGTEISKIVKVENTGKSDCYFRTLIAFEAVPGSETFDIDFPINEFEYTWSWGKPEATIEIDGVTYQVYEAVYKKALPAGTESTASLTKVELSKESTNEDMEALGGTYEILVLSQAVQTNGFANAATALDTAFGDVDEAKATAWFKEVLNKHSVDIWDGTADTSWYNDTDTEFELTSAEQFAGFAELVNNGTDEFVGKTVTLNCNVDLSGHNFTPIGGVDKDKAFQGTFDGQNNTITGLTENGWDLGYEYGQTAGMGLFGWIGDATIKNVTIDNAEISMEAVVMGGVAGYAAGDCTFENITLTNTQIANYNWDTGGIVGQVYGSGSTFTFKDITIDETNTISGHWGTWDVSAGGVIGRTASGVEVVMENIDVACVLDVYNDVCAAYQWYAYRYSGMLVGYTKATDTIDGRTVATAPHVTCKNVTVTYGDWANYTYCQASNVAPQYVRVQGGYSTDPYYSGRHWTAGVDANGNKMVDDNHVHADGEAHNELIVFDQLFGGGQGVYGTATHDGVKVIYNNK